MFLDNEFHKFKQIDSAKAATQWSQLTPPPIEVTQRMADILYVRKSSPSYAYPLFYLVLSDGQRYAVAITSKLALERSGKIDLEFETTRSAVVYYTTVVPLVPESTSQEFMDYIVKVNGCAAVLQVTSIAMQGRGMVLPKPLMRITPPPSNESSVYVKRKPAKTEYENDGLPESFQAVRLPKFRPIQDTDDESDDEVVEEEEEMIKIENDEDATSDKEDPKQQQIHSANGGIIDESVNNFSESIGIIDLTVEEHDTTVLDEGHA